MQSKKIGSAAFITTWTVVFWAISSAQQSEAHWGSGDDSTPEFSGFYSNQEGRFEGYVEEWVEEMRDIWTEREFTQSRASHFQNCPSCLAEFVDFAYLAGHGSPHGMTLYEAAGRKETLDISRTALGTGDLEYIAFHSCVVLEMYPGWRNDWRHTKESIAAGEARPFSGLHMALGFRTNHQNGWFGGGGCLGEEFGERVKDGEKLRTAWVEAAEECHRFWDLGQDGDKNKAAVFYLRPNKDETRSGINNPDTRYGDSDYRLDAYYVGDCAGERCDSVDLSNLATIPSIPRIVPLWSRTGSN